MKNTYLSLLIPCALLTSTLESMKRGNDLYKQLENEDIIVIDSDSEEGNVESVSQSAKRNRTEKNEGIIVIDSDSENSDVEEIVSQPPKRSCTKKDINNLALNQKISSEDRQFLKKNTYYAQYAGEILFQENGKVCGHISAYTTSQTNLILKDVSKDNLNFDEVNKLLPSRNLTPNDLDQFIDKYVPQNHKNKESKKSDPDDQYLSAFNIMDTLKNVKNNNNDDSLLTTSAIIALDEKKSCQDCILYQNRKISKENINTTLQGILNSYGYLNIILKPRIFHWISVVVLKNSDNTPFFIISDSLKKEHAQQCKKTQASLIYLKNLLTQKKYHF